MNPADHHPDVLRAKAEALTAAVGIAATYEMKGAHAGTVRMVLGQQALAAWRVYYQRIDPDGTLEAAADTAAEASRRAPRLSPPAAASSVAPLDEPEVPVSRSALSASGSSSGSVGLTASSTAADLAAPGRSAAAADPDPLDNVIPLRVGHSVDVKWHGLWKAVKPE